MANVLRVVHAGIGATIQDAGRFQYRRYGVTPAGPMDWPAFRTANVALGNDPHAAALEIGPGGLDLVCDAQAAVSVAFCGGGFSWLSDGQEMGSGACLVLSPGQSLAARPGSAGIFAYLAVAGGFATPVELGSRATHTRARMGGIDGRMLRDGDLLPFHAGGAPVKAAIITAPWLAAQADAPVRVVLGPQDEYFGGDAIEAFFAAEFRLMGGDRMAYRFDGPEIAHARGFNIVSDGVAIGAIQIAGDRKPLVLMADHPPTGGYPKLAHVARVDIGRLAQLRPGRRCSFTPVSVDAARAALLALEGAMAATGRHLHPSRG